MCQLIAPTLVQAIVYPETPAPTPVGVGGVIVGVQVVARVFSTMIVSRPILPPLTRALTMMALDHRLPVNPAPALLSPTQKVVGVVVLHPIPIAAPLEAVVAAIAETSTLMTIG